MAAREIPQLLNEIVETLVPIASDKGINLQLGAAPVIDAADLQFRGLRVRRDADDGGDLDAAEIRGRRRQRLQLEAEHGQAVGQLAIAPREIDPRPYPGQR